MMMERDINPNRMMVLTATRTYLAELAYHAFNDKEAFDQWRLNSREANPEMQAVLDKTLASIQ
jgi:hypothetical protein